MDPSITVALITSGTGIIIALIGAYVSSGKAVRDAKAPLEKQLAQRDLDVAEQGVLIARLQEQIAALRGVPHEP